MPRHHEIRAAPPLVALLALLASALLTTPTGAVAQVADEHGADGDGASLTFDAPETCPDEAAVRQLARARLALLTGRSTIDDATPDSRPGPLVAVTVRESAAPGRPRFLATIVRSLHDGAERVFEAESCDTLVSAAVLVFTTTALEVMARTPPAGAPVEDPAPVRAAPTPRSEGAADESDDIEPERSTTSDEPLERPAVRATVSLFPGVAVVLPEAEPALIPSVGFGIHDFEADAGVLAIGAASQARSGGGNGVDYAALAIRLRIGLSSRLGGAFHLGPEWEVSYHLLAQVGAIWAHRRETGAASVLYAAMGVGGELRYWVSSWLGISLMAEVVFPVGRAPLSAPGSDVAFVSDGADAVGCIGVVSRFP